MIKIDFHGSTHGHFLEYVANVYIMQTAPSETSIFKPPTYLAHAPDQNYLKNRLISCGHYSNPIYQSRLKINDEDQVIRIIIDTNNDNMFFVSISIISLCGCLRLPTGLTRHLVPSTSLSNAC